MSRKILGQYFTTNEQLLHKVFHFVKNKEGTMLEPSFGQGDIIKYFRDHNVNRAFVAIEIDSGIKPLEGLDRQTSIVYQDFLTYDTHITFSTIVGNPPYFKLKHNPNSNTILKCTNAYVAFIEKAYHMLDDNGELIFIIPSDFFKLTSAGKLKELMLSNGSFTDIYHPHKEKLFYKASQDVIVFRYQKGLKHAIVKYNDIDMNIRINQGNVYFKPVDNINVKHEVEAKLSDVFDVKVGMISGAENIFNNDALGNVSILTASGIKKEILIDKIDEQAPTEIVAYLVQHKKHLIERKIRKFNDNNWFQWGCLRNVKFMLEHKNEPCLYAKVLTRNSNVFFTGKVQLYDGSLLCMFPKQHVTEEQLDRLSNCLNSCEFLQHFLYSGRYKVGQKTLSDCPVPYDFFDSVSSVL